MGCRNRVNHVCFNLHGVRFGLFQTSFIHPISTFFLIRFQIAFQCSWNRVFTLIWKHVFQQKLKSRDGNVFISNWNVSSSHWNIKFKQCLVNSNVVIKLESNVFINVWFKFLDIVCFKIMNLPRLNDTYVWRLIFQIIGTPIMYNRLSLS